MKSILKIAIFCLLTLSMVADVVPHSTSVLAQTADNHAPRAKKERGSAPEAIIEESTIFVPIFGLNMSGLLINNLESSEAVITVVGYEREGDIAFTLFDTIEANGTGDYSVHPDIPGAFFGALVVSSDREIAAVVSITDSDFNFTTNAAYLGSSTGTYSVYLPLLSNNADGLTTWYNLQNAGSNPAAVSVEYSDGTSATAMIPVGAAHTFFQSFEGHDDGTVFAGTVSSDQPVVAAVAQAGPEMLLAYTGQTNGTTNPIYPLINQNNSGYVTGIQLQNIGTQASQVTIEYDSGKFGSVTLGTSCRETITIEPGISTLFAYGAFVDPTLSTGANNCVVGERFIGSARVVINTTNQPLVGVAYQQNPGVAGEIYGSFNPEDSTNKVFLPAIMDRYDEYFTGFQISHVGGPASSVTCTFSNSEYQIEQELAVGASFTDLQLNQFGEGYVGLGMCEAIDGETKIIGIINRIKSGSPDDTFMTYEGINVGESSSPPPPPSYDCSAVSQIPQSECEALVAIYDSTDGPNWINKNRWLNTANPCGWFGITCSGGHVTTLDLGRGGRGNGLIGNLPSEIGDLSNLERLDLWANQLDSIPDEISELSSLVVLDLDENNLSALPNSIGNLPLLDTLYLSGNQLIDLPESIGDLTSLLTLNLGNNHLSCVSEEIGNLYNLTYLGLDNNHITTANPDVLNVLAEIAPGWAAAQTAAPDWLGIAAKPLYLSASAGGRVDGVSYGDEDILVFDQCTNTWSLYFDGSDVGLRGSDVNAFHVLNSGQILFSLNAPKTLGGVRYDDSDIIRFKPTSLGRRTRGSFSIYFDGSDVQLTTGGEDIDAIARLSNGDLVISTLGTVRVAGVTARDEDLLRFHKEKLGKNTAGTWSLYLDGTDIRLSHNNEDIWAVWVNGDNDDVHLSTYRNYSAASSGTSQNGDSDDLFVCDPSSLGSNTQCQLSRYWDGDEHSFGSALVDGYSVGPMPPDEFINSVTGAAIADVDEEVEDLTEHQNDDVLDDDEYTEHTYLPLIAQ